MNTEHLSRLGNQNFSDSSVSHMRLEHAILVCMFGGIINSRSTTEQNKHNQKKKMSSPFYHGLFQI